MKVLLVGPECPETFWSFKHALRIISRQALLPPLGLLTVAAMLPSTWQKRLVDMRKYACMPIQYSRGCPFCCDFCGVTKLFGHRMRTKSTEQVLAELEAAGVVSAAQAAALSLGHHAGGAGLSFSQDFRRLLTEGPRDRPHFPSRQGIRMGGPAVLPDSPLRPCASAR